MSDAEPQIQASRELFASLLAGLDDLYLVLQQGSLSSDEPEEETSQDRQLEIAQPQQQ